MEKVSSGENGKKQEGEIKGESGSERELKGKQTEE